jgi:hypothetical protein
MERTQIENSHKHTLVFVMGLLLLNGFALQEWKL